MQALKLLNNTSATAITFSYNKYIIQTFSDEDSNIIYATVYTQSYLYCATVHFYFAQNTYEIQNTTHNITKTVLNNICKAITNNIHNF